jgi:hypothetical protein
VALNTVEHRMEMELFAFMDFSSLACLLLGQLLVR